MPAYLDRAKKKVKSLTLKILTKAPKSGHLRIVNNLDQTRRCPLFRGLTVLYIKRAKSRNNSTD